METMGALKGRDIHSPGQRPGGDGKNMKQALKGRDIGGENHGLTLIDTDGGEEPQITQIDADGSPERA